VSRMCVCGGGAGGESSGERELTSQVD
jgi:hypothetical protein